MATKRKKTSFTEDLSSEQRLDAVSHFIFAGSDGLESGARTEPTAPILFPKNPSSIFDSDIQLLGEMDDLCDSEDNPFGFDLGEESYATEDGDLSGGRGEKKEVIFSYEDWEQEEQLSVHLLTSHVRSSYQAISSRIKRQKALDFVFSDICDEDEISFTNCCDILQVRDIVLKTRVQYEFFLRWLVVEDMPFLTIPPPEDLLSEVGFKAGFLGIGISKLAWSSPGIEEVEIMDRMTSMYREAEIEKALATLIESGHISQRGTHTYFTGRNPERKEFQPIIRNAKKPNYRWSRLW